MSAGSSPRAGRRWMPCVNSVLYDILGCPTDADAAAIKTAYRAKSRQLHPDRNAGSTTALFQELQAAYACLSDPVARAHYDQTGRKPGERGSSAQQPEDFFESFSSFFFASGGPSQFTSTPRRKTKAASQTVDLQIDLKDLFEGRSFKFDIKKKVLCKVCKGSRLKVGANLKKCILCDGEGAIRSTQGVGFSTYRTHWTTCDKCQGTGQSVRDVDQCLKCSGEGRREKTKRINLEIGHGNAPDELITLSEEGDEEVNCDKPGDLQFRLRPKPQAAFYVKEFFGEGSYDLEARASLTLSEYLLGFNRVLLVHLDGTPIRVKRGSGQETRIKVPGQGFYKRDKQSRGDLWIQLVVEETLQDWLVQATEEQRRALEELLPPKRPDLFEGREDVVEA